MSKTHTHHPLISLQEQLAYMYSLERFGIKLGLEVMEQLLAALEHPERQFQSVHITGTNGKGSTAAFLESMLRQTGRKTGLYTSPHLVTFHERIRVKGVAITDEELISLIAEVREKTDELHIQPTFFEFTTAVAFLFFARAKVEIAVVEVGMGGLLDATNVITPLISIIANIGNDHMPMIGNNRQEIAENKAGIIKKNGIVVTAETNPNFIEYFRKVCRERQATLHVVQEELYVILSEAKDLRVPADDFPSEVMKHQKREILRPAMAGLQNDRVKQTFTLSGTISGEFTIPLLGAHQITNACTALLAAHLLKLPLPTMKVGLEKTIWPGRLDVVSTKPFILVDGAHNDDGIACLHQFLQETKLPHPKVLVLAVKKGKDMKELLKLIIPRFEHIIITQGTYEPEDTGVIAAQIKGGVEIPDAKQAIAAGKKMLGENDMMLVTGSLYMIGAALPD